MTASDADVADVLGLMDELRAGMTALDAAAVPVHGDVDAAFAEAGRRHLEDAREADATATLRVAGERLRLAAGDDVTIGRSAQLRVTQRGVSRHHLVVANSALGLCCYDLASANGSWRVRDGGRHRFDAGGIELVAGDRVVTLGDVELLEVLHPAEAV